MIALCRVGEQVGLQTNLKILEMTTKAKTESSVTCKSNKTRPLIP